MNTRIAILGVAALLSGLPTLAAQNPGGFGAGRLREHTRVGGKVTAVDPAAKSVTVERHNGPAQTFLVGDQTKIWVAEKGSLSDLKVGTPVHITEEGPSPTSTEITAKRIVALGEALPETGRKAGKKAIHRRGGVNGVVASPAPNLTVTTRDGETISVKTTDATKVDVESRGSFADLTVGAHAQALLGEDIRVAQFVQVEPAQK